METIDKLDAKSPMNSKKFQFDNFISIHTKQLVLGLTAFLIKDTA